MKISKKGEYALKAMIYLSLNYGKKPVQIQEISENENIPKKFLEQILLSLKKAGLLQSKQGMGGGYFLSKSPREISLAQVIRVIDGPLAPLRCVSKWAPVKCPIEKKCKLQKVMLEVRDAIAKILENITFEDMCERTMEVKE